MEYLCCNKDVDTMLQYISCNRIEKSTLVVDNPLLMFDWLLTFISYQNRPVGNRSRAQKLMKLDQITLPLGDIKTPVMTMPQYIFSPS